MKLEVAIIERKEQLDDLIPFRVENALWGTEKFPPMYGYIGFIPQDAFYLKLICEEKNPLRVYTEINDPIYRDSVMEAYLMFEPVSSRANEENYLKTCSLKGQIAEYIYDLLNQAEDNEDILSENERLEMTDIEKRRIYNRILLDSEEEQEEQSCDEQEKYQDNREGAASRRWTNIEAKAIKIDRNRQKRSKGQKTADSCGLHGSDLCRWIYSRGGGEGIFV